LFLFFFTYPILTYYNRIPTGTESCSKDVANILWDIVRAGNCILILCWNGSLLIHLKLCNWIRNKLKFWKAKITNANEIFKPDEFEDELETFRKIIRRLGKYLVVLNFACLIYLALDVIIVITLFENGHCDLKFYCSWSEIYFSAYKVLFLLVANWVAAKITKEEQGLLITFSEAIAFGCEFRSTENKYDTDENVNDNIERKKALKFSHNSLLGFYDMGKLGFTFGGFALTPSTLKGLIGSAISIVVAFSTLLAED